MQDPIGVLSVAYAIQLVVAPAFLLTGIGALLAVMANRLARVVDRMAGKLSLADRFTFSCAPIAHDKDNELAWFEACLHAFVKGRQLRLPRLAGWLADRQPGFLEEAEFLSKDVSLYAWLSYKFPDVYCDGEAVPELRAQLSRYIERELLRQNGFGKTSREAFQSRRW